LLLWKHILILKVVPKAASNFCSGFPLLSLVDLLVNYIRLSEQFSDSQVGFATTFKGTGGCQKAGTGSLERVTGMNFTICKRF
jgi:hypothetical protein